MAEALQNTEALQRLFADAFSPLNRAAAGEIAVAEQVLKQRQLDEAAKRRAAELAAEQTFRSVESQKSREANLDFLREQQDLILKREKELAEDQRKEIERLRKENSNAVRYLNSNIQTAKTRLRELSQVPLSIHNLNVRAAVQPFVKKKVLDELFRLDSTSDLMGALEKADLAPGDMEIIRSDIETMDQREIEKNAAEIGLLQREIIENTESLGQLFSRGVALGGFEGLGSGEIKQATEEIGSAVGRSASDVKQGVQEFVKRLGGNVSEGVKSAFRSTGREAAGKGTGDIADDVRVVEGIFPSIGRRVSDVGSVVGDTAAGLLPSKTQISNLRSQLFGGQVRGVPESEREQAKRAFQRILPIIVDPMNKAGLNRPVTQEERSALSRGAPAPTSTDRMRETILRSIFAPVPPQATMRFPFRPGTSNSAIVPIGPVPGSRGSLAPSVPIPGAFENLFAPVR